jgi:hypothetical protein
MLAVVKIRQVANKAAAARKANTVIARFNIVQHDTPNQPQPEMIILQPYNGNRSASGWGALHRPWVI